MRLRAPLTATLLLVLPLAAIPHDARPPHRQPRDAADLERRAHDRDPGVEEAGPYPSDWFAAQRAFPGTTLPQAKYQEALGRALLERQAQQARSGAAGPGAGSATDALTWTQAGPFNIGGRVTALAVVPGGTTIYLGAANGGVLKSTNSGANWTPVFDATGVYSIGALALDPTNSNVVYCGTGESNSSVDSYDGLGVFRSSDAGQSWQHLGLAATARIARIAVDPQTPTRVFVAAMGTQFSTGPDRGLYRSEDGGENWTRVLSVNDSTGVTDVAINPAHPDTVYCATWERIRRPSYRRAFGPGSGIWRSIDFGTTWTRLGAGLPTPSDSVGRIGLAIAPSRPSRVYAQVIGGAINGYDGRVYRSDNGGANWSRVDVSGVAGAYGGFGWYFGDIVADPLDANKVFALGLSLIRSTNGGVNFSNVTAQAHVDQHALWINPANTQRLYLGNDGGFYSSINGALSWSKSVDLPITQFYAGSIDPSNPARLLGGTQDNNCLQTPGSPSSWNVMLGGDGFYTLVDPISPSIVFAEYQNGSGGQGPLRSTAGGGSGSFTAPAGFDFSDRYNWCTPFVMDPNDHNVMLAGSHRVYKSTDNGQSYVPVSGDLTTNPVASLVYGTISTLDVSPADSRVYYAGTDDGRVWRSTNSGGSWQNVSAGLPVRWVTRVTADPLDPQVVYVTLSGFGLDEHLAHVYRSANQGDTWTSVSGNLPDIPANDLVVDPTDTQRLYLGTDIGVYASLDRGQSWFALGTGMPLQAVFDVTLHSPSRRLVAATHGRSQWSLDLTSLPVAVEPELLAAGLAFGRPQPNPSRGVVRFTLQSGRGSDCEIAVFDPMGRRTRVLFKGFLAAGRHPFSWNGLDERGRAAPAGVYLVRALSPGAAGGAAVLKIVRSQ
jgi:photosystem II stability/assembly factor-like uncharacterized protein